ncbi:vWA domain-containing protein, partial [Frankia sp. Cas3]|uniref:vWA domain-containing protein n=1 Tax=Frankia sp. Cas3 TaxID=3073926 RepID=UPI002AD3BFB7
FESTASVAVPPTDVGGDGGRSRVKEAINRLSASGGSTNWDAALTLAGTLRPDVIVLVTDGMPDSLGAAAQTADRIRGDGVRIVAVGVDLRAGAAVNIARVSGYVEGDDYFTSSADNLLRQLYQIASKSCGIPVAALPQPEGGSFPLAKVIGGMLGALAVLLVAGLLLSRQRAGRALQPALPTPRVTEKTVGSLADPTIGIDDPPPANSSPSRDLEPDGVTPSPIRGKRRISPSFLFDDGESDTDRR